MEAQSPEASRYDKHSLKYINYNFLYRFNLYYEYGLTNQSLGLGAIHKLRHTNFIIFFYPSTYLVTGGHISETAPT
jgi:hypothetical protein